MTWNVSDADNDTLTCSLDVNDDGAADYTIDDCANNTSQAHTFATEGAHVVRLTVSDGTASPVQGEQTITVILPLAMVVSVDQALVVADNRLIYTVTVGNRSPMPVNGVSVLLRVPAGLSFTESSHAEPDADGCPANVCNPTAEAVWDLDTLVAGESRTITINALVDTGLLSGNLIAVPIRVTADKQFDTMDLLDVVQVYNAPSADLALSASTDPVVRGETFTFQVDVGNTSGDPLINGQLRATLPAGVSVDAISDGGVDQGNGEIIWDIASLNVEASLRRTVTVIADSGLVAGQILQAAVQLTHDGGQAVDNIAEHVVTVVSAATKLNVDISTSANPVVKGERVLYTLTLSNTAQVQVDDVRVLLRVPAGLSFTESSHAEPDADGCPANVCNPTAEAVWDLDTLVAGESRTITINALVDTGLLSGNLIAVPIRVTADKQFDTMDLLDVVQVYNAPSADLALSASTDPVVRGETFTFQVDVGNTSGDPLINGQLRATLPAGVSVDAISDGGVDQGNGEIIWDIASLNVEASLRRTVTVIADSGLVAGQILQAAVQLTHDGGQELDDSSQFAVSVTGSTPPVSATIAATPDPVASGDILAYTITVTNGSAQSANAVSIMFRVPAGLSFVEASDTEPDADGCPANVCNPTAEAVWDLATLAAGASQVITINATVASGLDNGTLISVPVRVTATELQDTINLQHTTVIGN